MKPSKYTCQNLNGTLENPIFLLAILHSHPRTIVVSSHLNTSETSNNGRVSSSFRDRERSRAIQAEDLEDNSIFIDEEYLNYRHYLASRSNHGNETFGSYDEIFGRVLGNSSSTRRLETAEELPVVERTAEELMERGLVVCAICREELAANERLFELPCRHYYHKECISNWLTNEHLSSLPSQC